MTLHPSFQVLGGLRRWRQGRRPRPVSSDPLPPWALAEVRFTAAQADWLLRVLCGWHALPLRAGLATGAEPVSSAELLAALQSQGIEVHLCRLVDAAALCRGDVVMVDDSATARLFGDRALAGGGLALVVDIGRDLLRLAPALAPHALSCRPQDLRGVMPGWGLRSRLRPGLRQGDAGWAEGDWALAT